MRRVAKWMHFDLGANLAAAPDVNIQAERAKHCGLESSPEGVSFSQYSGFSPVLVPGLKYILAQPTCQPEADGVQYRLPNPRRRL